MKAQPFGASFPISFYVQQCGEIFGPQFDAKEVQMSVNRTNIINGGLAVQSTRIVFPNGSIDPWNALGITTNAYGNFAIYINGLK